MNVGMGKQTIIRQFPLLNGLAILGVVCHHAAGWGYTAMFWWADRYRAVSVPNFDQVGTLPYYALRTIQQITIFAVPSFLFMSGFFISYIGRGNRATVSWKPVVARLKFILIPYLIWSVVIFAGNGLQGIRYSPVKCLWQLVSGSAVPAYWYVPLLFQFYLLSPFLLPVAKTRGKLFLLAAALLQVGALGSMYLALWLPDSVALDAMIRLTPGWSFVRWAFFFASGVFCGFRIGKLKQWLSRLPWTSLLVLVLLGLLSVLEAEALSRNFAQAPFIGQLKLSSTLYAIVFVVCFLRFARMPTRFAAILDYLGKRSYGIYLLHPKILELAARVIRQGSPWILGHQLLFQPLLIATAIVGVLLLMWTVAKSSASRYGRYLFG